MRMTLFAIALCAVAALAGGSGLSRPALAGGSSDESMGGTVRLLPGHPASADIWRAGLEFELKAGWKTYWRVPGDSGVPPVFDWSGSSNLAEVAVLWPSPELFEDGGGHSVGYTSDVILPLHLHPKDPSRPIRLHLRMDYAVCSTLCVPAHAELALDLDPAVLAGADGDLVAAHEARVPIKAPAGAQGSPALSAVSFDPASQPPQLKVTASGPAGSVLLVEGPATWFFAPARAEGEGKGGLTFTVPIDGAPKDAVLSGTSLRLTLATPDGGVEGDFTIP